MTVRPEERFPLASVMVGNASLLSSIYLGFGLLLEVVRRLHPSRGVVRASLALDRLPASVLDAVGLLEVLREAYLADRIGPFALRLVFGLTTVAVLFALAVLVGGGMWGALYVRARFLTRAPRP